MATSAMTRPGRAPHHRDARRQEHRLVDAVRDEHDGEAARRPERGELVVQALPREFVERAERLVHQQEIGRGDERAGDRGAHLHAARELAREMAAELREPDLIQRGSRAASVAAARSTPARSSGSRTFASTRAHGISVGAWNTKPRRRPGPPVAAKSPPHQRSVAAARRDEPGDQVEQRGLAAAGRPEQRQEFAALDGEVDRRERARAVRDSSSRRRRARRPARLSARWRSGQDLSRCARSTACRPAHSRRRPSRARPPRRNSSVCCHRASVIVRRPWVAVSPPATIAYSFILRWP